MESFPFNLSLNYKMEVVTIKPPSNFTLLSEVICEKYDLHYAYIFYDNDLGETEIKNDTDYVNFLNFATDEKLDEIEIHIRSDDQMSQQRKLSLRKRSTMKQTDDNYKIKSKIIKNNEIEEKDESNNYDDDYEIGMQCDYDYYGDTRNRKGMIDSGYSDHNYGFKERKRIYYIKQKKDMQREEQMKNINHNINNNSQSSDEDFGKKNKKRKLKNKKKKKDDLSDEEVDEKKFKKQGKKGRVMIKGGYRGGY